MGEPAEQRRGHLGVANTFGYSAKLRLVVMMTLVCSYSFDSR
jgi:hypothetical protein